MRSPDDTSTLPARGFFRVGILALGLVLASAGTLGAQQEQKAEDAPEAVAAPSADVPAAPAASDPSMASTPPAGDAGEGADVVGRDGAGSEPPAADAQTPPPPTEQPAATGTAPPPAPPSYRDLGVPPEDDTPEGEWDPWENAESGGRKHGGFFLRLSFGFGYGVVKGGEALSTGDDIGFTGGTTGGSFAIGGTIVAGLSLHADFFFSRLVRPAVSGGREDFDYGDPGVGVAGIGLTYHFRSNFYVGVSGGAASVNWERQTGEVSESAAGFGGHALLGKEWWVDADWGVGIGVQAIYATVDDNYYDRVTMQAYHLLLSATYN